MADLPDRLSLFAVGRRSIITTANSRINPKTVDVVGSDINLILGAQALMGENISASLAVQMRNNFVETAFNDGLDRVAFDRYQLTRLPASPSSVTLTISRPTAAFGAFTYQASSRVQTASGVQFATDLSAVFGALDLVKTVTATALETGPGSNVSANTITQFVEQPADTTASVNNVSTGNPGALAYVPGGAAGGVDDESDPDFKARILDYYPTVRRGVLGAIEYGARQVGGVAVAKAVEINNPYSDGVFPSGFVELIVADKSGGFSATMLQRVRDQMLTYRSCGIPVIVSGGVIVVQPVTWKLRFNVGVDQERTREEVRAVTVAITQFLSPGSPLLRSSLLAGARAVTGAIVSDDALPLPVGDTLTATNKQLIRVTSGVVSFV